MSPYTHLCCYRDTCAAWVEHRHISETQAILDQQVLEASGITGVVVMPIARDELAEYPQPTPTTATKSRHDTRAKVTP